MSNKNNTQASFGRFDFVANIGIFGGISLLLTVLSLLYLSVNGVNYGIDFRGGTEIQVKYEQPTSIEKVRESLSKLNFDIGVQALEGNDFILRFQGEKGSTDKETNELLQKAIVNVKEALTSVAAGGKLEFERVDSVGPQVGADLKRSSYLSVFYCLLVILIYVSIRYDYKYSPGAVVCLFHDAVITLAIFVVLGNEVNVPTLAAILTLMGFSLNDTIVVFDRIRETAGLYKDKGSKFIINKAINDMLGRTFITAGSLFVTSACLYLFANGIVKDIAFIITVGLIFGVYSSIYVAAPLIIIMEKLRGQKV